VISPAATALILLLQVENAGYPRSLKEYPAYKILKPPAAAALGRWSAPRGCGVRFRVPLHWAVAIDQASAGREVCTVSVAPREEHATEDPCAQHEIDIRVLRESLADTLTAAGFTMYDGKWRYRIGSVFDGGAAEMLRGPGWTGFHGASTSHTCGAAQTVHDFVLGNSRTSVILGAHESQIAAIDAILPTIRLSAE